MHHDTLTTAIHLLDLGAGSHMHPSTTGVVCLVDTTGTIDDTGSGEIGTRQVFHQATDIDLRILCQR